MKTRAILMLGLAVLLGLVAVYMARGWIESQTKQVVTPEDKINLTTVVIAKRPLSLGDTITAEYLEEAPWPANAVPQDSFRKMDELVKGGSEARVALRSIQVNEPILKHKVTGFGGRATLSTLIDKGKRGVTIRVNDVIGVGGFILPGDHVDVILTRKVNKDDHITNVLIQNVKVLGVDQEASDNKDKPQVVRAVTLEATTEQGQKLALASTVGTLSLALRDSLNTDAVVHRTIREKDLVDDNIVTATETPKPVAKVKATVRRRYNPYTSVNVVRGLKATTEQVVKEKARSSHRPASGGPVHLTPKPTEEPATATTAPKAQPKSAKPARAPAVPAEKGAPIPLWREKDGKTVHDAGAGPEKVSALASRIGG